MDDEPAYFRPAKNRIRTEEIPSTCLCIWLPNDEATTRTLELYNVNMACLSHGWHSYMASGDCIHTVREFEVGMVVNATAHPIEAQSRLMPVRNLLHAPLYSFTGRSLKTGITGAVYLYSSDLPIRIMVSEYV